jgi:hypothetical protein
MGRVPCGPLVGAERFVTMLVMVSRPKAMRLLQKEERPSPRPESGGPPEGRGGSITASKSLAAATLLILVLAGTGCVERTISITSEPEGALVYLNDEEVGRTPLTVPFTFYGLYDVRLEKDGYKALWTTQNTSQPLWDYMGPDLVAEAIPGVKSELKWHFALEPKGEEDPTALTGRARQMRALVARGDAATQPADDK